MNNANTISLEALTKIRESDQVKKHATPEQIEKLAEGVCFEFMEKFSKCGAVSDKVAAKLSSGLLIKAQQLAASGAYNEVTEHDKEYPSNSDFCPISGSYRY